MPILTYSVFPLIPWVLTFPILVIRGTLVCAKLGKQSFVFRDSSEAQPRMVQWQVVVEYILPLIRPGCIWCLSVFLPGTLFLGCYCFRKTFGNCRRVEEKVWIPERKRTLLNLIHKWALSSQCSGSWLPNPGTRRYTVTCHCYFIVIFAARELESFLLSAFLRSNFE